MRTAAKNLAAILNCVRARDSVYSCCGNSSGTVIYNYKFEPFCVCNIKSLVGALSSKLQLLLILKILKISVCFQVRGFVCTPLFNCDFLNHFDRT